MNDYKDIVNDFKEKSSNLKYEDVEADLLLDKIILRVFSDGTAYPAEIIDFGGFWKRLMQTTTWEYHHPHQYPSYAPEELGLVLTQAATRLGQS